MPATETTVTPSTSKTASIEQAPVQTPKVEEKSKVDSPTVKKPGRVARLIVDFFPSPIPADVTFEGSGVPMGSMSRVITRVYRAIGQSKSAAIHKLRIKKGR